MPADIDTPPYRVSENGGKYQVVDARAQVVLVSSDAASAAHYAQLLNTAWKSGYKTGYRARS